MLASDLTRRILKRLGEDPTLIEEALIPANSAVLTRNMYYRPAEVLVALNQLQRFFVFMTLCLETTATFTMSNAPAYKMLTYFPDWIAPLRVRGAGKIKPARLADFAALDAQWTGRPGVTTRYAMSGIDLMSVHRQSTAVLTITYARSPVYLAMTAEPEIPQEDHEGLIEGAIPLLRIKEGQQEWQKTLPSWGEFMAVISRRSQMMRARVIEQGYDSSPTELLMWDRSILERLKARA